MSTQTRSYAHTYELEEARCCSDECTGSFWGSGCTKSADDGPTFYFILLYSQKNPRALMHSILKTPQTKSFKPLEKFLRDQQVSLLHSTGDSPGWLMTHPASASLDTGGEMNKWIKPWVSRHQALGQTKARLEISVLQHKENGNESVRLCIAKRESKNGTRWETQAKRPSSCQVTACSLMHTRTFVWRVGGHESKVQEHFLKASKKIRNFCKLQAWQAFFYPRNPC